MMNDTLASRIAELQQALTILPNNQNGKMVKWVKPISDLPHLPDSVYNSLPPFLQRIIEKATLEEDRDVTLLGVLGCLSACFSNVRGIYDKKIVTANLFFFVVADAGMGKGALTPCRDLVVPINRLLQEESAQQLNEYRRKLAEYQKNKSNNPKEEPKAPPLKTFIIPANSSASSFLNILADNEGIGLLFETEGDTLSQTFKSDYGNYSDMLRKAFHHETISMSRRKDREYVEISNPRISVVLAGTPEQVRRLIPDAENGLLSRFVFYFIPFRRGIRDVFAIDDISISENSIFEQFGKELLRIYNEFHKRGKFMVIVPRDLNKQFKT